MMSRCFLQVCAYSFECCASYTDIFAHEQFISALGSSLYTTGLFGEPACDSPALSSFLHAPPHIHIVDPKVSPSNATFLIGLCTSCTSVPGQAKYRGQRYTSASASLGSNVFLGNTKNGIHQEIHRVNNTGCCLCYSHRSAIRMERWRALLEFWVILCSSKRMQAKI